MEMIKSRYHRLKMISTSFIDPRWMNMPEQTGKATDHQTIEAFGEVLVLHDPEEITLQSGQEVYVWMGRNFTMETFEEREIRQREREQTIAETARKKIEADRAYREKARNFNASLCVPVRWAPGIKDVLSGLSKNSLGNGRNGSTVNHVLLKEDLTDGRLVRRSGDFLCTSASGTNGKNWGGSSAKEEWWTDSDQQEVRPPVTCKECLRLAARWRQEHE